MAVLNIRFTICLTLKFTKADYELYTNKQTNKIRQNTEHLFEKNKGKGKEKREKTVPLTVEIPV